MELSLYSGNYRVERGNPYHRVFIKQGDAYVFWGEVMSSRFGKVSLADAIRREIDRRDAQAYFHGGR